MIKYINLVNIIKPCFHYILFRTKEDDMFNACVLLYRPRLDVATDTKKTLSAQQYPQNSYPSTK